jgi:hypothetical protein
MDWIDLAIRDLCEIPGRDSPDDAPEMLLVTPDEIRDAFERRLILAPVLAEIADDMLRMRYAARRKKKRTHRSNR